MRIYKNFFHNLCCFGFFLENRDINQVSKLDLLSTGDHQLNQFFSLTHQFFGPLAEAVLQREAPELV